MSDLLKEIKNKALNFENLKHKKEPMFPKSFDKRSHIQIDLPEWDERHEVIKKLSECVLNLSRALMQPVNINVTGDNAMFEKCKFISTESSLITIHNKKREGE